jgi:hypothetical protein
MTAVEVVLLLMGVVFLLGSFFITEKLSPEDVSRVAQLSEEELQGVMNRELEVASAKISDMVDNAVDLSMNNIRRTMEKDSNEKIMAIGEYSDTVMEQLKKTNSEVTFLYSMLGDKHEELRESMILLSELMDDYEKLVKESPKQRPQTKAQTQAPAAAQHQVKAEAADQPQEKAPAQAKASKKQSQPQAKAAAPVPAPVPEAPVESEPPKPQTEKKPAAKDEWADRREQAALRKTILERYRTGDSMVDIARELDLGLGEVKLIVDLYKGEKNS